MLDGETVLSEAAAQNKNTHSVSLMPMTERCLESAGLSLADVDALALADDQAERNAADGERENHADTGHDKEGIHVSPPTSS